MKTSFDVLDIIYPALNTGTVQATLDGRIYRRKRPINSKTRDIELVSLSLQNPDTLIVNTGTIVVNCWAPNLRVGTDSMANVPDETNLKSMSSAVIAALEAYSMSTSCYFHLDVDSETLIQDFDDPQMSYVSLRVSYNIQK